MRNEYKLLLSGMEKNLTYDIHDDDDDGVHHNCKQ